MDNVVEEKAVIQTTHTHRVSAPSVFLQKQENEPVSATYFEQRVPVPEDNTEVTVRSARYRNTGTESMSGKYEDMSPQIILI